MRSPIKAITAKAVVVQHKHSISPRSHHFTLTLTHNTLPSTYHNLRSYTFTMSSNSSSHLSSPSLVSVATTSSATSSTPLRLSSSSASKPKDYSAAFGQLQSQYGWGGSSIPAPVSPAVRRKEKKEQRKEAEDMEPRRESRASSKTPPSSSGGKDYETAFGTLSSRFGFGGSLPTLKRSSTSKAKDERR